MAVLVRIMRLIYFTWQSQQQRTPSRGTDVFCSHRQRSFFFVDCCFARNRQSARGLATQVSTGGVLLAAVHYCRCLLRLFFYYYMLLYFLCVAVLINTWYVILLLVVELFTRFGDHYSFIHSSHPSSFFNIY